MNRGLQQRLTAGHLGQVASIAEDLRGDLLDRHRPPLVKRVFSIAPRAAQIASGESHEGARAPRPGRFALDAEKDLVDPQPVVSHRWKSAGAPRLAPVRE